MTTQTRKQPLILGFGHKARQGKDEAAKTIVRERGDRYQIVTIAFADALRKYVNDTCEQLITTGYARHHQDALEIMCLGWGAEFDEHAPIDDVYPHGKQRKLLQAVGQGRRDEDPDYWVDRWEEALADINADVIIVTDMRYPNEMQRINSRAGQTVKFTRRGYQGLTPEAAAHISETILDGAQFHHYIEVADGEVDKLRSKALALFDYIIHRHNRHNSPRGLSI